MAGVSVPAILNIKDLNYTIIKLIRESAAKATQLDVYHRSLSVLTLAHYFVRYISNHANMDSTLAIIRLGLLEMPCGEPGTRTSTVSILRSFNA